MQTLQFSIDINATPTHVWKCLWQKDHYTNWTSAFCQGSYYETNGLEEGNVIRFLTPEGHGMFSIIHQLIPDQFMAFKHMGNIADFKDEPLDDDTKKWTGAIESYEVIAKDELVTVNVKVDTVDEYINHMNESFPRALEKLKILAEKSK
ncbi:MAG: hypothetical protein WAT79_07635 [Saprospiraceae bacterium]